MLKSGLKRDAIPSDSGNACRPTQPEGAGTGKRHFPEIEGAAYDQYAVLATAGDC